jgi:hypothetical protein
MLDTTICCGGYGCNDLQDLWREPSQKHFSWWWKNIISAGLAGSVLLVLALHMSAPGPITHFARFICGYLGLVFCAVSLGCGVCVPSIRSGRNGLFSPSGRNSLRHFLTGFANLSTCNSRNNLD